MAIALVVKGAASLRLACANAAGVDDVDGGHGLATLVGHAVTVVAMDLVEAVPPLEVVMARHIQSVHVCEADVGGGNVAGAEPAEVHVETGTAKEEEEMEGQRPLVCGNVGGVDDADEQEGQLG